ncbi:hypothetical protein [Nocardia beijingensis]
MATVVAFNGQVRDEARFLDTLQACERLSSDGICDQVVYADWKGELDAYPAVRAALRKMDAAVIELRAMRDRGPGNSYTQVRSLNAVLDELEPNDRILKLRPDGFIAEALLRRVLSDTGSRYRIRSEVPAVFSERIWVPWFHTSRVLHLSDEAFCGRVRDVRKLQSADARFERAFGTPLSYVHVRRFAPPFFKAFPDLEVFFEEFAPVVPPARWPGDLPSSILASVACQIPNYRYLLYGHVVNVGLEQTFFPYILAVYYAILKWYFYIDGGPRSEDFHVRRGPIDREIVRGESLERDLLRDGDPCVRCYSADWLELVFSRRSDGVAERIREMVSNFDADPTSVVSTVPSEIRALETAQIQQAIRRQIYIEAPRIIGERSSLMYRTRSLRGTAR